MKNEFLALEDIPNIQDGKLRYDMLVKAYNEPLEHRGINDFSPSQLASALLLLLLNVTLTYHQDSPIYYLLKPLQYRI